MTGARDAQTWDVVVVGARAAGAATAFLLGRAGLRVLLVDRGRYGSDTMSTHALMRGGVLQLARWGLLDAVVAAGTPPVRRTSFRYAQGVVGVDIEPAFGVDALYAPRRTVLDRILVDAAVKAGARVRFGAAVTDVCRDPHGSVCGVVGRYRSGDAFEETARFVVGADGMRSTVASLVEAPVERVGRSVSATTYGYWSGLPTDGYEWNFVPRAASGAIPTNHGQACVFASSTPGRVGRGGLVPLTRLVAESSPPLAARLAEAEAPSTFRTFRGNRAFVRRSWGSGWALVGDAGYFKDPITAHGLTDALRDAELLARAILDGDGNLEALAEYQAMRDLLSVDLFDVTDTIAGHAWSESEIPVLLVQLSRAMSSEASTLASLSSLR